MTDLFYVVSLSHSRPRQEALRKRIRVQPFVVFWRPDNNDYCNCIEHAGLYTAERIAGHAAYYDSHFHPTPDRHTMAVAPSVAQRYLRHVDHERDGTYPACAVDGPGHVVYLRNLRHMIAAEAKRRRVVGGLLAHPIALALTCPKCKAPHLDTDEWATKPHKTHLCLGCGNEWRPCNFPTVGVAKESA